MASDAVACKASHWSEPGAARRRLAEVLKSSLERLRLVLIAALLVVVGALGVGLLVSSPDFREADEWPLLPTRVPAARRAATLPEQASRERPEVHRDPHDGGPRPWPAEEVRRQAAAPAGDPAAAAATGPAGEGPPAGEDADTADSSGDAIQSILVEAGLSPAMVEDLQRRFEHTVLTAANAQSLAAREGWLDSPRFAEQIAAIEAERRAIRAEIGDEAYDLFLFATGELNRTVVAGVEGRSPADVAGLETGDVVLSYDRVRIFSPGDLAAEIDAAPPGGSARLIVRRQGRTIRIDVPTGPLGASFAATQEVPQRMRHR
jgi:hypothetical protein